MKDLKGFIKIKRRGATYRPVCERVKDYKDVVTPRESAVSVEQVSRCMDCGTPFCHWACPAGHLIPEWNDLVCHGHWKKAYDLLQSANNFPEITGRICPALCEYACVLGINADPVTIRENELDVIEHAFEKGFVKANPPEKRTGKKVAVIGSGPSGLACADDLNKLGHKVTVFERDNKPGGILRYGIPDFKLEKWLLDRRLELLRQEGIEFKTGVDLGDSQAKKLLKDFDAVVLAIGSRVPRDLNIDGRGLNGVHFALDYLSQANKRISGEKFEGDEITAAGKAVIVIGGGDTGSDCVGTANRQKAKCVAQIELLPRPSETRTDDYLWPKYPLLLKTTSSHEEGTERHWSILTKKFTGVNGAVKKLHCVKIEFVKDEKGAQVMREIAGSQFEIDADLVILAMGFLHPQKEGLVSALGLELDKRGNIKADQNFKTSNDKIFACGDGRRGQSLIVWAISEGKGCAKQIDSSLTK
jgi:glutamate synthase (NADPH) small chain